MQVIFYISLKRLRTGILYYTYEKNYLNNIGHSCIRNRYQRHQYNNHVDVETPSGNMNSNIKIFAKFV